MDKFPTYIVDKKTTKSSMVDINRRYNMRNVSTTCNLMISNGEKLYSRLVNFIRRYR